MPRNPDKPLEHEPSEQIARRLVRSGYLISEHFEIWLRQQNHETIYSMRKDYPRVSVQTLYAWVEKVNDAIRDARLIDAPEVVEKNPFGISVAISHHVHMAADTTPTGGRPRSYFPDAQLLRASGKLPR